MNKETVTLLVNGVLALAVVVVMAIGRLPFEYGVIIVAALATPSAIPSLLDKLRETRAAQRPPRGPSAMGGILLFLAAAAHLATFAACRDASPPPRMMVPAYCYDEETFTAKLLECVGDASTRQASRTCRAEVHAACGYADRMADAGGTS